MNRIVYLFLIGILLTLFLVLFGCSSDGENIFTSNIDSLNSISLQSIIGVTWHLTEMEGLDSIPYDITVSIQFDSTSVHGHSGCNEYFGSFELGEDFRSIDFIQIITTYIYCPGIRDTVEGTYYKNLMAVSSYNLSRDNLHLRLYTGNSTEMMHFVRVDSTK